MSFSRREKLIRNKISTFVENINALEALKEVKDGVINEKELKIKSLYGEIRHLSWQLEKKKEEVKRDHASQNNSMHDIIGKLKAESESKLLKRKRKASDQP